MRSILRSYRRHKRYVWGFAALAALTALVVALSLRQQGNAMIRTERVLDCPVTGMVAHTHDESCYDSNGNLVCSLPERELHVHDDSCYTEERVLTCELAEGADHEHTDECYETVRTLVCGLDEITETHVHGAGCFETVTVDDGDDAATTDSGSASAHTSNAAQEQDSTSAETHPAQTFRHQFKDADDNLVLKVEVEAPEGALPKGSTMVATWVDPATLSTKQQDAVDAAIAKKTEGQVLDMQAVDITFRDASGAEVEPAKKVTVTLTSALISADDQALVVHIDDLTDAQRHQQEQAVRDGKSAEEAEPARKAEAVDALSDAELSRRDAALADDQLSFDSDKFSTYVLAVTSLHKVMQASDGATVTVTVDAPAEAGIPQDAELQVQELAEGSRKYVTYSERAAEALGASEGLAYARLFDISIVVDGQEIQPVEPVAVQIELADAESDALSVVHFADGSDTGEVLDDVQVDDQTVSFAASGFSVYAVVDEGSIKQKARVTVNFYGKDTSEPLATVYVKEDDTAEEIEQIVVDPGCGTLDSSNKELFDGWVISTVNTTDGSSYTIETEGKTIEDVRAVLDSMEIREGDVLNVYAKIVRTITITYQGEDENTVLGSVTLKVLGSDDPNSPDSIAAHDISMNYTPETATQAFMGWNVAKGASHILSATFDGEDAETPYQNGTTIRVNGDVTLSVNAPNGHWLVFDENGKGATYNAPVFIEDGETTSEPTSTMTRLGYRFDGWYTDKDCTAGNEFTFGSELTDNTTVYAKWTSAETANYTVIVWKERMTDTYAENGGTGEGKEKNYDFAESFTFTGSVGSIASAVSNGSTSVVDGDPAETRYYNARIRGTGSSGTTDQTIAYTGYHCAGYDTNVEITPEGNAVVNVYYDRNTVTYTFYTHGQSSTSGIWWLCKEDGTQIVRSGQYATNSNSIATRDGNEYSPYTGRVAYDDGKTYYYSTTGACRGTYMREAHWEYVTDTGSSWNVYQESIGLYGESLDWPADTNIFWYERHSDSSGTGTRMTYKSAFLPLDDDMTVEYWGNRATAAGKIHFWTQDVDGGDSYTKAYQVSAGNANFSINDKFTGFYAYQYRTDNGSWQNVGTYNESTGIYGNSVSYNSRLDIRYNRIKNSITFLDGSYFDGNGNRLDETPQAEAFYSSPDYFYEADVSSYNKDGADYYTPPEKSGYTFAGWYADDACTVPYDFNTMPVTGITVYAKWVQNQYRVFLHSNVPESDTTLSWGSQNQDMTFRVSSGSKVSTPTGSRTGYKFIGWYLDEACTQVFDGDRYVLNDTSVTTPYDKTVDMTDEMNKYGNIVGEGYNSDLTGDNGGERFWITRKLDLYAKWRAELVGAEGIGVVYDANGGSSTPSDTNLYLDNTDTVAQGATNPPDDSQQFLYWVLQTWDEDAGEYVDLPGEENRVYPGDSFTVLKDHAKIEELDGSTPDDPRYRYTVQLRAQYGPKEEPTPTHLTWYGNGGAAPDGTVSYTDSELQVNEAVDIRPEDTFVRPGYEFIGWARIDSSEEGYTLSERDLTEDDLFLRYEEDGTFSAQITEGSDAWSTVTMVAADERDPYHDLYAVWKKKTYTVTVTKVVNGLESDNDMPFTFTPEFAGLSDEAYATAFQLVGNENGADVASGGTTVHYDHTKTFVEVPYETTFSIQETIDPEFIASLSYEVTNADTQADNKTVYDVANGSDIVVKGDVAVTVTNTRESQKVRVLKTEIDEETPLEGAVFTVTVDGVDYTLTSDDDGYLKSEHFADGIMHVPYGTYELEETTAPEGYIALGSAVSIRADRYGVHATGYTVEEPTDDKDYYTLIVPNSSGVELPATGGSGVEWVYLLGAGLMGTGVALASSRRVGRAR